LFGNRDLRESFLFPIETFLVKICHYKELFVSKLINCRQALQFQRVFLANLHKDGLVLLLAGLKNVVPLLLAGVKNVMPFFLVGLKSVVPLLLTGVTNVVPLLLAGAMRQAPSLMALLIFSQSPYSAPNIYK